MTNPKGASFERLVADYLNDKLVGIDHNRGVDRQIRTGAKDKGDIRGVYVYGRPLAIECKNTNRLNLSGFVDEAEIERGNADAVAGVVVHKRRGRGKASMGEQYVTMTLADLVALLTGERPVDK
jgi:hypothetical protein